MPEPYSSPETGDPNVDGEGVGVGLSVGVGAVNVGLIDDSKSLIDDPNSVGADNVSPPNEPGAMLPNDPLSNDPFPNEPCENELVGASALGANELGANELGAIEP